MTCLGFRFETFCLNLSCICLMFSKFALISASTLDTWLLYHIFSSGLSGLFILKSWSNIDFSLESQSKQKVYYLFVVLH